MHTADSIAEIPPDLRERFEERAAIKQYCGGMSRPQAEAEARSELISLPQPQKPKQAE
jgi:hypothetical protein